MTLILKAIIEVFKSWWLPLTSKFPYLGVPGTDIKSFANLHTIIEKSKLYLLTTNHTKNWKQHDWTFAMGAFRADKTIEDK